MIINVGGDISLYVPIIGCFCENIAKLSMGSTERDSGIY